jgi:hypothetical protein
MVAGCAVAVKPGDGKTGQEHLLLKEQPRKEARITCGFHHFSANAEIFD